MYVKSINIILYLLIFIAQPLYRLANMEPYRIIQTFYPQNDNFA